MMKFAAMAAAATLSASPAAGQPNLPDSMPTPDRAGYLLAQAPSRDAPVRKATPVPDDEPKKDGKTEQKKADIKVHNVSNQLATENGLVDALAMQADYLDHPTRLDPVQARLLIYQAAHHLGVPEDKQAELRLNFDNKGSAFKDGKLEFSYQEKKDGKAVTHLYKVDVGREQLRGLADLADEVASKTDAFGTPDGVFRGICHKGTYYVIHNDENGKFALMTGTSPKDLKPGTFAYDPSTEKDVPGMKVILNGNTFTIGSAFVADSTGTQVEATGYGLYMTALPKMALQDFTSNWNQLIGLRPEGNQEKVWVNQAMLSAASLQNPEFSQRCFLHGVDRYLRDLRVANTSDNPKAPEATITFSGQDGREQATVVPDKAGK